MMQVPSDKYNVAWFKLAECVARGEKERALGVYRLLSHSIEDQAFAVQLEGDILLAFNDKAAVDKYVQAAKKYIEENRLLQAAAVYEHAHAIEPNIVRYTKKLIELYTQLKFMDKVLQCQRILVHQYLEQKQSMEAHQLLVDLLKKNEYSFTQEQKQLVLLLLEQPHPIDEQVNMHLEGALEGLMMGDNAQDLQQFLTALDTLNPLYHEYALKYLKKNS